MFCVVVNALRVTTIAVPPEIKARWVLSARTALAGPDWSGGLGMPSAGAAAQTQTAAPSFCYTHTPRQEIKLQHRERR